MLAVLKTGGAYVPLDSGSPSERVAFMLADASVAAVVTQETLRGRLPADGGVAVVSVDGAAMEIARERADDLECQTSPRSLAYVIYTSGSTGIPKGVAVEQSSLCNLCTWHASAFGITRRSGDTAGESGLRRSSVGGLALSGAGRTRGTTGGCICMRSRRSYSDEAWTAPPLSWRSTCSRFARFGAPARAIGCSLADVTRQPTTLGAFSVSLAVKSLQASREFYEKLDFAVVAGDAAQNWLILRSGTVTIGLFQGMFERNILTFNPG